MATKEDKDRVARKKAAAAAKIAEIAPHADLVLGMLSEDRLDMLLLALGQGKVTVSEDGGE